MSQYRQKEVDAIKASEAKEYRGKYALAKHETLALRCENLEKQLAKREDDYRKLRVRSDEQLERSNSRRLGRIGKNYYCLPKSTMQENIYMLKLLNLLRKWNN